MKPFPASTMGGLTSDIVAQCLTLAEEVKLSARDLATLCGVAPATLYRWRKEIKEDRPADPDGSLPTVAFMNLLIFRRSVQQAIEDGTLPNDGKKGAKAWVRSLAPELFDTDAS